MKFKIQDKNFDELTENLRLYPLMRVKLQNLPMEDGERQEKLNRLFEAELSNNIALLYYGYRYDCMEDILGKRPPNKPQVRGCCVNFGNTGSRDQCMSRLCGVLAELNFEVINSSVKLMFYYNNVAAYIEQNYQKNHSILLYDCDFWSLYFSLYEAYQQAKDMAK